MCPEQTKQGVQTPRCFRFNVSFASLAARESACLSHSAIIAATLEECGCLSGPPAKVVVGLVALLHH